MSVPTAVEAFRDGRRLGLGRLPAWFERESLLVTLTAFYAIGLVRLMPREIYQDGWYALLAGREIVQHGLPDRDALTLWTLGQTWIDQPWASQAAFYLLYVLGGLKLVLFAHTFLVAGAFGLAMVGARRLGASPRSVLVVALPCVFVAPWAWQFRSQSFAYPLFVAVLWLLAADSRKQSNRVFLVLPLLILWGNLHGSVALGILLVVLRGVTVAVGALRMQDRPSAWKRRAGLLIAAPVLCLFVSPYGPALASYYGKRPSSSALSQVNVEWQATKPSLLTALFFCLAFFTVWVIGRHGARLTPFERLALIATIAIGLYAIRAVVWVPLAALLLLPLALDGVGVLRDRKATLRRANVALGLAAVAMLLAFVVLGAVRPASYYESEWSQGGADAVARAAAEDPDLKIFASSRFADWLLWEKPALRGRVAFDIRFGMLSDERLRQLLHFRNRVGDWKRPVRGFGLFVLETEAEDAIARDLLAEPGSTVLYRDDDLTVIRRASASPTSAGDEDA